MRTIRLLGFVIALAGIMPVVASGAPASDKPASDKLATDKPASKNPTSKKPVAEISIQNERKVALKSFEIAFVEAEAKPGRKPKASRKPVLKLEEALPAGEKTVVKLKGAKGCTYIARWVFEDVGDEGPIDICGDPKIVLTD